MNQNKPKLSDGIREKFGLVKTADKTPPAERYNAPYDVGLTSEQVAKRTEEGYANTGIASSSRTVPQIIAGNLFTYYNLIFFAIGVALVLVKSFNNLLFLTVVVANIIIGIVQELNSKKVIDSLTLLTAPKGNVIRNGIEERINTEDMVLDDVVIFGPGDQIYADAVVLCGEANLNEALVTGESDEIPKKPNDMLLSGSFVVSGHIHARLDKIGGDSFVSKLTLEAKRTKKTQKPGMMRSLTMLIKIIGVIIIPLAVVMFFNQVNILGLDNKAAVETVSGSLIGMIPEGLYLLTSIALATSVIRLAKRKTVVHDLKCIETLARVDVLCVDKTGTITEDKMNVSRVISLNTERFNDEIVNSILVDFTGNMGSDNNTMRSLKEYFGKPSFRRASSVLGFSSATKYSAVQFSKYESYVLGAPEFILKSEYRTWQTQIEKFSGLGERVLLLAEYNCVQNSAADIFNGGEIGTGVVPIALVTLINRIRPEAPSTFEYFKQQGVAIKVISGDNPLTVSEAARQACIENSDKYIDASAVDSDEALAEAAENYTVFGRVTPEQKRILIKALKKNGHTVAMTGDGVNDVLALKDSDCSIAMATGSDVASKVSDLVLLDSNFASMPAIVGEGRRVINNVERSASLFIVKNIFSFVLTIASLFVAFQYPFSPAQLSIVNGLMIGFPSFILALEPNESLVRGHFLGNVMIRSLPAALTDLLIISGTLLFADAFNIPQSQTSTICVILFGAVGLLMLYRVCQPFNWIRKTLWWSMGILFLVALVVIGGFFDIVPLNYNSWLVLSVFIMLAPGAMHIFTLGVDKAVDFTKKTITKLTNNIKSAYQ